MSELPTAITITLADGTTVTYYLDSGISPEPGYAIDFTADFAAYEPGHVLCSQEEWNKVWQQGLDQGACDIFCLEQSTDATENQFSLGVDPELGPYLELFMPKGSYGMDKRSCQVKIGKPLGPVNCSFRFSVVRSDVNLFTAGGGKWGGAWQYGPIQSGPTGGVRFMGTWAAGASSLGKQDLTCSIQNQPDGGQWLQPPYYGFRPIEPGHWYDVRFRMTGGSPQAPTTVRCQYWKDDDPVMDYTAETDNSNVAAGSADVFWDLTSFFGGTEPNAAPDDARFRIADMRIWVETP